MLSATSHIGLEFLTKFLNMSKLQNWLILLYQSLPLQHLTSFLLKNAFKRREKLVLALFSLVLHNSKHLHHSQCFHCVKTDSVHKTRF